MQFFGLFPLVGVISLPEVCLLVMSGRALARGRTSLGF